MVKIRLMRVGRKGLALYRVVATKSEAKRNGKPLAFLGTYDPASKKITLKSEETMRFLNNGAQPTRTANTLLVREGLVNKNEKSIN